jgi:hypothetical protein
VPTPTDSLEAAHLAAGSVYADAVKNYWESFCELYAIELAMQNRKFRTANTAPVGLHLAPDPIAMVHPTFAFDIAGPGGVARAWADKARDRANEIIKNGGVE